jgi:hypothetical protein
MGRLVPIKPSMRANLSVTIVGEGRPEFEVAFQVGVFSRWFWRNDASGAVQAKHRHWVACGYVGRHAVAAIEFFAALTLLHVGCRITLPQIPHSSFICYTNN